MRIVTASVARSHLSDLLGEVAYAKVEVLITRRGKPLAKLVPVDQREREAEATDNLVLLEDDDPFFKAMDDLRDASLNPAMPVPGSLGP